MHDFGALNERIEEYTARKNNQSRCVAVLAETLALSVSQHQSLHQSLLNNQTRTPGGSSVYKQSSLPPKKVGDGNQPPLEAAGSQVMQVAAAGSVAILLTTAEGVAAYFEAISALTSAFAPWIIAGQVVGGIALLALGYHVAGRSTETEAQGASVEPIT
jgi:hypothetical protein